MVSAWATANRVVLGQVATDAKSNEITAIPQLLALLLLKGCIVTIDAMGCQTKIAEQIIEQGGDYVLALKGNQGTLAAEVEEAFIDADARDYAGVDTQVHRNPRAWPWAGGDPPLPHLGRSLRRTAQRPVEGHEHDRHGRVAARSRGKITRETRFYIGSIGTDVACFARAVRGHWGVENDLHWSLDVAFREDDCRVREPAARENLAVLRHIALTRLKNDNTKLGIKNKRLKAGWDERYLEALLFQPPDCESTTHPLGAPNIRKA